MKTNLNMLIVGLALCFLVATPDAQGANHKAGKATQAKRNQVVKVETYSRNNPNTVIGGSSQRNTNTVVNPWWKTRNDSRMNIRNGSNTMEVVRYQVVTFDRQSSNGSRMNDSYRRTVRQVRVGQQVR